MKNFAKHFKKLLIIPFLIPSIALAEFRHFNEWSNKEKALFLTYGTVAYIDHRQTRIGLRNGYTEKNPIYGNNPHRDKSVAINMAVMGIIYWGVGSLPEDKGNLYLLGATLGRTAVVIHNDSVGVSWTKAF